jgi:hypothetical protein
MTRRAASRTALTSSWPLLVGMLVIGSAAGLLAACGGGNGGSPQPTATVTVTASPSASPSPSPSPSALPVTRAYLYFLRHGKLGVAERRGPQTTMPATAAMKALLKGPTAAERIAGLRSSIASGTRLVHLTVSGGVATVDLSRYSTGAPTGVAVGQIVFTLTRFPTIRRVRILIDGSPLVSADVGDSASGIYRRADFDRLEPAIFVENPGVGATLASPFDLSGTASVFEGSFTAVLVDGSGRRIVRKQVQASQGAPGRGRFRMTVPFTTSATEGTVILFSVSMEDGSHQDEVRIPVTFAQD